MFSKFWGTEAEERREAEEVLLVKGDGMDGIEPGAEEDKRRGTAGGFSRSTGPESEGDDERSERGAEGRLESTKGLIEVFGSKYCEPSSSGVGVRLNSGGGVWERGEGVLGGGESERERIGDRAP